MKTDATDNKILAALVEDGRASCRKIARRTSLTAPTVSFRMKRMIKAGVIQGFVPVIRPESAQRGIIALLVLKALSDPEVVAERLAKLREVESVYLTTGGNDLTVKVVVETVQELRSLLTEELKGQGEASVLSNQIVTRVVKESVSSPWPASFAMDLRCEFCDGEVTSQRPYNVAVGLSRYYFCCKTCRSAYLEKHGPRLTKLVQSRRE